MQDGTALDFATRKRRIMEKVYIASDLGAGSGRVIAGRFNGSHLKLQETNRFDNPQTNLLGHVHCQMTADALGVPVLCGPTEGAIAGNILVQMIAMGDLKDQAEARELMRVSEPPIVYEPNPERASAWDEALNRFVSMRNLP